MGLLDKYRSLLPKQKNEKELGKHYDEMDLEKGDLAAMLIAALITFGPVILIVSLVFIGIAMLFGM